MTKVRETECTQQDVLTNPDLYKSMDDVLEFMKLFKQDANAHVECLAKNYEDSLESSLLGSLVKDLRAAFERQEQNATFGESAPQEGLAEEQLEKDNSSEITSKKPVITDRGESRTVRFAWHPTAVFDVLGNNINTVEATIIDGSLLTVRCKRLHPTGKQYVTHEIELPAGTKLNTIVLSIVDGVLKVSLDKYPAKIKLF